MLEEKNQEINNNQETNNRIKKEDMPNHRKIHKYIKANMSKNT